jgi:hypothetical protein
MISLKHMEFFTAKWCSREPKGAPPVLALSAVLVLTLNAMCSSTGDSGSSARMTVWAWEREEDLRFLSPSNYDVAYYAGTILLDKDQAVFRPRLNKLKVAPGANTCPVFRFENRTRDGHHFPACLNDVVRIVSVYQSLQGNRSVQLDFDAVESERAFYLEVLRNLRKRLREKTHICITALASWCLFDQWLSNADADEAVAMLFSLGPQKNQLLKLLGEKSLQTGSSKLRLSIGISAREFRVNRRLDELGLLAGSRRVYLFSSLPWTAERLRALVKNNAGLRERVASAK